VSWCRYLNCASVMCQSPSPEHAAAPSALNVFLHDAGSSSPPIILSESSHDLQVAGGETVTDQVWVWHRVLAATVAVPGFLPPVIVVEVYGTQITRRMTLT